MKIYNLTKNSKIYTSNVYLVLGDWKTVYDVNTLIDAGQDKDIIKKIEEINTGLGKKKIDQVVITHSHSDHIAIIADIKNEYSPKICAYNEHIPEADCYLKDGDELKIGDKQFEVFHITTHSNDSICLFCEEDGILFSGDTQFPVDLSNEGLKNENKYVLERLSKKNIKILYPGHGDKISYTNSKIQLIK